MSRAQWPSVRHQFTEEREKEREIEIETSVRPSQDTKPIRHGLSDKLLTCCRNDVASIHFFLNKYHTETTSTFHSAGGGKVSTILLGNALRACDKRRPLLSCLK